MCRTKDPEPHVTFDHVTAGYNADHVIFDDASFRLTGPSMIHLQGKNGSGKSTFLELVSGYLTPWSGTVRVNECAASNSGARASRRTCRSDSALFGSMTTRDHIIFACTARDTDPLVEIERAENLGLAQWLHENAGNLSTGNARKLWYIMNTVGNFSCVVLDEPFNGVDHDGVETIATELREWAVEKLVIFISHSLNDLLPDAVLDLDDIKGAPCSEAQSLAKEPHER